VVDVKEMKELKLKELSLKQKLGMVSIATINTRQNPDYEEYVFNLIKERALGAVWVQQGFCDDDMPGLVKKIKELADYPILIVQDAESGVGDFMVGKHNAIGLAGTEEHAYAFGKCVGVTARNMGYNMICDPVVDLSTTGSARSLGGDKEKVAALAVAIAKGLHDSGILTVAKHYPGGSNPKGIDSHMTESFSEDTVEDLLSYDFYPYIRLIEEGLLDGIMTRHRRFVNIDPNYPATLSKKVIDIIRNLGFNGVVMTDALSMMGIRAKFSLVESKGLAISAGVDLLLHWQNDNKVDFDAVTESYEKGMIKDDILDAAVQRVLDAQHKTLVKPKYTNLTGEDIKMFESINKDCIYAKTDENVPVSISRDGRHFFAVLVRNGAKINSGGKMDVDTFSTDWHQPLKIEAKIKEVFPNSEVEMIDQFPGPMDCARILSHSIDYDDVVFITFSEALAYTGPEHLTRRIENIITAMQHTNRISTIMHFGNPFVLENLGHIPRNIIGAQSKKCVDTAIDVLAGLYPANGKPTYNANLK
jgi:beta-glucosidase-like glycosyl hydrolase